MTELKQTLGELPKQKSLATFLLANMIYTDGLVSLFAFGGIYAAGTFGWHTIQIGTFGIVAAIAGVFGAWLGGRLDDRIGPKRVIAGSMLVLLLALAAILLVDKDSILFVKVAPPVPGGPLFSGAAERAYLVLGCLIGAAGGPLQAASRTMLIRLAPKDRIAQCFGLFALTGKVTSFIGPLLIGVVTAITASQKAGMALLVVFFVVGLVLLARVRAILRQSRMQPQAQIRESIRRVNRGPGFRFATSGLTLAVSMPEMPHAGEHHGDAGIVGGLDDFLVADRAAGLDHGGGAGFDRDQQSVGEREERI